MRFFSIAQAEESDADTVMSSTYLVTQTCFIFKGNSLTYIINRRVLRIDLCGIWTFNLVSIN